MIEYFLISGFVYYKGVVTEGRKFNDVLFALLFLVMAVGMIIISGVAYSKVISIP